MSPIAEAQATVKALKDGFGRGDLAKCNDLIRQLKLSIVNLPGLIPGSVSSSAKEELTVAREGLEYAVMVAVKSEDEEAFQRAFSMLQPCYAAAAEAGVPRSQHQNLLTALHLMFLLVENRTAEFHMELELLSDVVQDPNVRFVVQVEQWLMDGAYSKVSDIARDVPDPGFKWFMSMLVSTMRSEVASCIEKAYASLSVRDAKGLLMVDSEKDVADVAAERGWRTEGGLLVFQTDKPGGEQGIPAVELISNSLMYARELERIV